MKIFTLEEFNSLLPKVRPMLVKLGIAFKLLLLPPAKRQRQQRIWQNPAAEWKAIRFMLVPFTN